MTQSNPSHKELVLAYVRLYNETEEANKAAAAACRALSEKRVKMQQAWRDIRAAGMEGAYCADGVSLFVRATLDYPAPYHVTQL